MSEHAAILATFAGFNKPVIGRRVVPLVFEVPIEQFQDALKKLGTPDAANPVWCGIARTNLKPGPTASNSTPGPAEGGAATTGANAAPPSPKPNSTRAVMMAKDPEFWAYLSSRGDKINDEAAAEMVLKQICAVRSKAELNGGVAAVRFDELRSDFQSWRSSQRMGGR